MRFGAVRGASIGRPSANLMISVLKYLEIFIMLQGGLFGKIGKTEQFLVKNVSKSKEN